MTSDMTADTAPDSGTALHVRPVILSGGAGSRLWPLSRALNPKQFLPVANSTSTVQGASMLQETLVRVTGEAGYGSPLIVANSDHHFRVLRQLCPDSASARTAVANIILEPEGRNTTAAIALAALWAADRGEADVPLLIMPSDHVINDVTAFHRAVAAALPAARAGFLVTFGVKPGRPETGYGYICRGVALDDIPGLSRVDSFVEKPDLDKAARLVADGLHFWNAGIFLLTPDAAIAAITAYAPEIMAACRAALAGQVPDGLSIHLDAAAFCRAPAISFDHAVMEKTDHAAVVPVDMGWSDVGSWDALWAMSVHDAQGCAARGDDNLIMDCKDSLFYREHGPPIVALGVENLVAVSTRDAVLIIDRRRSQDVRRLVDHLKQNDSPLCDLHARVHRPWGTYEVTDTGPGFQTKRLVVWPGEKLSLQRHRHRSEHWVVVSGTARVTLDAREFDLQPNESTYIPVGSKHRLANPGDEPLHIVEVQCGDYLGEDDIERFDDVYGRTS